MPYNEFIAVDSELDENSTNAVQNAAIAKAINGLLKRDSPDFTGVPTAPTPTEDSPDDQIATKGYIDTAFALAVNSALDPTSSRPLANSVATIELNRKAPLDSPVFTGSPMVPDPDPLGNPQQIVNIGYLDTFFAIGNAPVVDQALDPTSTNPVRNSVVYEALIGKAPINSPNFTGIPTVPTAPPGTESLQIANAEFVYNIYSSIEADIAEIMEWRDTLVNAEEMEF